MSQSVKVLSQAFYQSFKANPANRTQITERFMRYLMAHKQEKLLPDVIKKINTIETHNIITITTARTIDTPTQELLERFSEAQFTTIENPRIIFTVNPAIIGGVVISSIDQELNYSVNKNLDEIKEQLCLRT